MKPKTSVGVRVDVRQEILVKTFSIAAYVCRMSKNYERLPESAEAFVHADESPDGEEASTCLRFVRRFLHARL